MARKQDINVEDLNLDLDLNLEEEIESEVIEEMEGLDKAVAPKEEKPKKEKKAKKEVVNDGKKYIGANQIAEQFGVTGLSFRSWLRSQFPQHPKGASWKWEEGSRELQEIIDAFAAYKAKPKKVEKKKEESDNVEAPVVNEDEDIELDLDIE